MNRKNTTILAGSLLAILFGVSLFYLVKPATYRGMVIDPPFDAASITGLTDSNGAPFQLEGQRGKFVLVFFGYTNCPDQCPTTLAKLKVAVQALGDQSENVQVVLITTDPIRDSVERLNEYVSHFHVSFLGLTGTLSDLQAVWNSYGVVVEDGGETHSELVYVIDPAGKLRLTFSSEMTSEDIINDLNSLLAEQ